MARKQPSLETRHRKLTKEAEQLRQKLNTLEQTQAHDSEAFKKKEAELQQQISDKDRALRDAGYKLEAHAERRRERAEGIAWIVGVALFLVIIVIGTSQINAHVPIQYNFIAQAVYANTPNFTSFNAIVGTLTLQQGGGGVNYTLPQTVLQDTANTIKANNPAIKGAHGYQIAGNVTSEAVNYWDGNAYFLLTGLIVLTFFIVGMFAVWLYEVLK